MKLRTAVQTKIEPVKTKKLSQTPVKTKVTYQCPVCEKSFVDAEKLKRHSSSHSIDRHFNCHICVASFQHASGLKRHVNEVHATGKNFECTVCQKKFSCPDYLSKHQKTHESTNSSSCSSSVISTSAGKAKSKKANRADGKSAERRPTKSTIKKVEATPKKKSVPGPVKVSAQNGKTPKSSATKKISAATSAPTNTRKRSLPRDRFADTPNRKRVRSLRSGPSPVKRNRKAAGKKLISNSVAKRKDKAGGRNDDEKVTANHVKKEDQGDGIVNEKSTPDSVEEEPKIVGEIVFERLVCPQPHCCKPFSSRVDFERHAQCHVPPDVFTCDQCGEIFFSKGALATHIAEHARENELSRDGCGKNSVGLIRYQMRRQADYGDVFSSKMVAEFECMLCGLVYDKEVNLRRHVKKEHAKGVLVEVFACALCDPVKIYRKEYNFRAHFESVHEILEGRDYSCVHCDQHFQHKINLQFHMQRRHKNVA